MTSPEDQQVRIHQAPQVEARALFRRAVDGELSAAEFRLLEQRLLSDAALRAEYVKFVDLEACLYDELQMRPEPVTVPLVPSASPRRWTWAAVVAGVCGLVLTVAWWPRIPVAPGVGPTELTVQGNQHAEFLTAPLQGLPDVAVVTATDEPVMGNMTATSVGARLKPGVLTLTGGELQLDFLGGSRLLLRGPAELHLVSASAATLVSGTASVRVPYSQAGFVLSAAEAAVITAGTEFAAEVLDDRRTLVQVYSGMAEVSLLGEDGSTLISHRLGDRSALTVDAAGRRFLLHDELPDGLPRVRDLDQAQLVVTDDYVRAVERSKPYLYWRFDKMEDGQIPDALGGPYAATIIGHESSRDAIRIENGVAVFLPSFMPRCISSASLVPEFNRHDFTIELWIMPTELKASALFSTVLPEEGASPLHLNFLEIAYNTNLVHKPGVIRFLHRQPPSTVGGYNLFTQEICTPGAWSHIVATKSPDELRLYVNGQLLRSVSGPGTGASDELSYRVVLGQLGVQNGQRQFHGMMDEVALYDRVLRAEEISRHYWAIRSRTLAVRDGVPSDRLIAGKGR